MRKALPVLLFLGAPFLASGTAAPTQRHLT